MRYAIVINTYRITRHKCKIFVVVVDYQAHNNAFRKSNLVGTCECKQFRPWLDESYADVIKGRCCRLCTFQAQNRRDPFQLVFALQRINRLACPLMYTSLSVQIGLTVIWMMCRRWSPLTENDSVFALVHVAPCFVCVCMCVCLRVRAGASVVLWSLARLPALQSH